MGTSHDEQYTFFIIFRSILLRTRNVSHKICSENHNTHFTLNNFFPENRAVYVKMCTNMVQPDRPHMTIWRMRFACWIAKTTKTHTICNVYCFSTATVVARTCLSVTLYVHCLSCYNRNVVCLLRGTTSISAIHVKLSVYK